MRSANIITNRRGGFPRFPINPSFSQQPEDPSLTKQTSFVALKDRSATLLQVCKLLLRRRKRSGLHVVRYRLCRKPLAGHLPTGILPLSLLRPAGIPVVFCQRGALVRPNTPYWEIPSGQSRVFKSHIATVAVRSFPRTSIHQKKRTAAHRGPIVHGTRPYRARHGPLVMDLSSLRTTENSHRQLGSSDVCQRHAFYSSSTLCISVGVFLARQNLSRAFVDLIGGERLRVCRPTARVRIFHGIVALP